MEEIKYKLCHGGAADVEAATHRLEEAAAAKGKSAAASSPEVAQLWHQIKSGSPSSTKCAAKAILTLVRKDMLDPAASLAQLLSLAPQVETTAAGLVAAVAELALMRRGRDGTHCKRPDSHPLVSLLRSIPSAWPHVHSEVRQRLCSQTCDEEKRLDDFRGLMPVVVFALSGPNRPPHLASFRQALIDTLLTCPLQNSPIITAFSRHLVTWFDYNDATAFCENATYVIKLIPKCSWSDHAALTQYLVMTLQGYRIGIDPQLLLDEAFALVSKLDQTTAEVSLMLIAKMIEITSTCSHFQLIKLSSDILKKCNSVNRLVLGRLLVSVLPHLSRQKRLTQQIGDFVFLLKSLLQSPILQKLYKSESTIMNPSENFFLDDLEDVTHKVRLMGHLSTEETTSAWLGSLKNVLEVSDILLSIVAASNSESLVCLAFTLLTDAVTDNLSLSQAVLTVAMYKLSNSDSSSSPEVRLHVLQKLPTLGKNKGCIGSILQLVRSLESLPGLASIRLNLLYRLWQVEDRIFPHLQRLLEQKLDYKPAEHRLTKALVARDVILSGSATRQQCQDLLPHLSSVLTECTGEESKQAAVTAVFALEGIAQLCKDGVIDIKLTIGVLEPTMWGDHREDVLKAYLNILELVPSFSLKAGSYSEFRKDTLSKIWSRLGVEARPPMREALFRSLACFQLQDHTLAFLPAFAKDKLKYPSNYNPPTEGPLPKPEDVWSVIPGWCWIKMICDCPENDVDGYAVVALSLLKEEIAKLPRGVNYQQNKREEPANFNNLPDQSLLRAAVSHLLNVASNKTEKRWMRDNAVFQLLMGPFDKKLPPFDWFLLSNLGFNSTLLRIAAFQSQTSSSARSLILRELGKKNEDCEMDEALLETLIHFAPTLEEEDFEILQAFIEDSIRSAIVLGSSQKVNWQLDLIKVAVAALGENAAPLNAAMSNLYKEVDVKDEDVYKAFLRILPALTGDTLDEIIKCDQTMKPADLTRCLEARSALATSSVSDSPLAWISPVIELVPANPEFTDILIKTLRSIVDVIRDTHPTANRRWLLELMAILSSTSRRSTPPSSSVTNLFRIFTASVVYLSNLDVVGDADVQLPLAINKLIASNESTKEWRSAAPQICEWMVRLCKDRKTPETVKKSLLKTFPAFKSSQDASVAQIILSNFDVIYSD